MVTDASGNVAMAHKQSSPKQIRVGRNEYLFLVKRNISFAWVRPEDVDKVLAIPGNCGCSGANKTTAFRIASEQDYRIWNGLADR